MMNRLVDPTVAVTSADPGQIYRDLASCHSLVWSDRHEMWVAAHPEVVREVLDAPVCHVRPPREPVPAHLRGTVTGMIFGQWARMREGQDHQQVRAALTVALDAVETCAVHEAAELAARSLLSGDSRFAFDVSAIALGQLIGVPEDRWPDLSAWTAAFARCLAPTANDDDVASGERAAESLWHLVSGIVLGEGAGPLAGEVGRAFDLAGLDADMTVANLIGLLFQAHDAVAGLIGNAAVHVAHHPGAVREPLDGLLKSVLSSDAPIQNTRRFVAQDTVIAGQAVREGDMILVILAIGAGSCPFGHGRHTCPGQDIAMAIAEATLSALMHAGRIATFPTSGVMYAPSSNARIPVIDRLTAGEARS